MLNLIEALQKVERVVPIEDYSVQKRLNRAYDMVRDNGYGYSIVKSNEDSWIIHKASTNLLIDNSAMYTVQDHQCTCPDDQARGGLCKHVLAVMLLEMLEA